MSTPITRKARQTGLPVTVGRSEDIGLDTDGICDWWTICEHHSWCVSHETRRLAESHASDPQGWCEICAGQVAP